MSEFNTLLERYILVACKCKLLENNIKNLNNRNNVESLSSILNSAEFLKNSIFDNVKLSLETLNEDDVTLLVNKMDHEVSNDKKKDLNMKSATYFRYFVCKDLLDYLEKYKSNKFVRL